MKGHAHPQLGIPVAFLVQFGLEAQDFFGAAAQDDLRGELKLVTWTSRRWASFGCKTSPGTSTAIMAPGSEFRPRPCPCTGPAG